METIKEAAEAAMQSYRGVVESNDQAIPMLSLLDSDDQLLIFGMQLPQELGTARGSIVLKLVHDQMRDSGMPTMRRATWVNEVWLHSFEEDGSEGPLTEAITCTIADATDCLFFTQTFVRTKDGVRWEEPQEVDTSNLEGEMIPALRRFVTEPA